LKCNLISYNKFIKLQPFIIVFVDVSATAAAFNRVFDEGSSDCQNVNNNNVYKGCNLMTLL